MNFDIKSSCFAREGFVNLVVKVVPMVFHSYYRLSSPVRMIIGTATSIEDLIRLGLAMLFNIYTVHIALAKTTITQTHTVLAQHNTLSHSLLIKTPPGMTN